MRESCDAEKLPMIDPRDIRPLTEFQRNAKATIARLKKNKRPVVLTVNGRASIVVVDAKEFARMETLAFKAEEQRRLETSIDQASRGKTIPADQVFAELRRKIVSMGKPKRRSA
jgi:prevent-host-death family protein